MALPPVAEREDPCAPRASRRGFTIFELIVAIVLTVALASIALPVLSRQIAQRSFESAVERSATHVLLARAHAQAGGEPVEVLYDAGRRAWMTRRFVIDSGGGGAARLRAADDPLGLDVPTGSRLSADDDERVIPEGWALEVLPARVSVSFTRPVSITGAIDEIEDAQEPRFELPADTWDVDRSASSEEPTRFAVLLPDGTALLRRTAWIMGREGRAVEVSVNPWSGVMESRPVTTDDNLEPADDPGSAAEPDAGSEDDASEPADEEWP